MKAAGHKGTGKAELSAQEFIQKTVWDFFIDKGFSEEQVAGIMGNAMQESSWNPLRRGTNSGYWGLFQINSTMATELEEKYRASGLDMSKYGYNESINQGIGAEANISREDLAMILEIQLDYVYGVRPTGSDWISAVSNATSVEVAAEAFLVRFEGATTSNKIEDNKILYYELKKGHYYQETDKRREYAKEYYQLYTTK